MNTSHTPAAGFLRRNEHWLWLLLIVVLAVVVRVNGFTLQGYWYDELFSAHISKPDHSLSKVVELTLDDVHPPLFQIVMWWSYRLFGYNEIAGRLPSLFAGIAAVPVIYLLGRDLISRRVGLYAAALAITNSYLVFYAQEARSYAFLYLLGALSFLYFLRALRSGSRVNLFLYVLSTVALLYTHYYVFVVLAAQGVILIAFLLFEGRVDQALLKRAALALGLILLALVPLIPSIAGHSRIEDFWIPQPGALFVPMYFIRYFGSIFIAGIMAMMVFAGLSYLLPRSDSRMRFAALVLLIWVAVGYLVPWLRGLVAQPILTDRNTIVLVPPLLLLAGMGLMRIPWIALQRLAVSMVVVFSLYHLAVVLDYDGKIFKAQYRLMTSALTRYDEKLPVYAQRDHDTKYNVYFEQQGSALRAVDVAELEAELESGVAPPLFWLVDGHGVELETDLDERFGLIEAARYMRRSAIAALLINPAAANNIPLTNTESQRAGYASFTAPAQSGRLLLAVTRVEDDSQPYELYVEALNGQGNVISTRSLSLSDIDTALQFVPGAAEAGAAEIRVSVPDNLVRPGLWLLKDSAR